MRSAPPAASATSRPSGSPAAWPPSPTTSFGFGRLLEDVLDALPEQPELVERFRPLATACTGPLEARPQNAAALVTRLRVEHA